MKKLIVKTLVIAGIFFLVSCNEEEGVSNIEDLPFINPDAAEVYIGTQSPGDVWTWTIDRQQGHMTASWDAGTFDDESDDIYIEGELETLPSGYFKVVINQVEPANEEIPTDGSAWFYALEIPGMSLVIKPEGNIKGDMIAMIASGDCADVAGTFNYVLSAPGNGKEFDPLTEEAFGIAEFTPSGDGFSISGQKFSLDCVDGGCTVNAPISGLPTAICEGSGSVAILDGGTVAQGQFTQSGAMMMDFGYGNGGVFAMKASNVPTKSDLDGNTYLGLAYTPTDNDEQVRPVKVVFTQNEAGQMEGIATVFTNIETGEVSDSEGATIFVDNVIDGRAQGYLTFPGSDGQSPMSSAYGIDGDNQLLILSSFSQGDNSPFIVVLAKN
ncbi:MAG: hypothetical protein ACFHWX_01610 [Bacteroidota bacterium]